MARSGQMGIIKDFGEKVMDIKFKNNIIDLTKYIPQDYKKISDNHFRITADGESRDCFVASDEKFIYAFVEGTAFSFEKISDMQEFDFSASGANSGREEIKPPMPGSVVKVLVELGQSVAEGDGLIIVEAMKMETTIYSSIAGKVMEINAEAGMQVDATKTLLVVERQEAV